MFEVRGPKSEGRGSRVENWLPTLLRSQRPEGLLPQDIIACDHAHDADEDGRDQGAGGREPRVGAPRNVEDVAGHAPGERYGTEAADRTGEEAQHAILEREHR